LHEAVDAFFAVLDRYTLADLLKPAPQLAPLLGLTEDDAPRREHRPEV
jgi:DNA-binding IscR family transcriptional regulator